MAIKPIFSNANIRAPIFRAIVLASNLLLFRIYASYHGAEGVAFINALTSVYSFWIISDFGLLSIVVREKAKYGSAANYGNLKQGLGALILKCATTVWLVSSAFIVVNSFAEKGGSFPLWLLLLVNFIFYISLITSTHERQAFASGKYSSILLIQIASNIIISAIIYFFYDGGEEFLYTTTVAVTSIPLVTNILCYFIFRQATCAVAQNEKPQSAKLKQFISGGHWSFVLLTGFSIIGNSYDAYLFYRYTNSTTVATFVGVVKLITPFYSLLQSFIIQNWPVWENKLFTSREESLPLITNEVKKMQINCVVFSAPLLLFLALFGEYLAKFILNLNVSDNGTLLGVCLYRLCTAYVDPLHLLLTTEGFIKNYLWIIALLNFALLFTKWLWLAVLGDNFLYLFAFCGLLNLFFIGYLGRRLLMRQQNCRNKQI